MNMIPIPPLRDGERLSRAEFERRYEAMPENIKAELIEGVVYMASPVRCDHHGFPHACIMGLLTNYVGATPGTKMVINTTVRLDEVNEPQPDAGLFILPAYGGQCGPDDDDYLAGAPDLTVEVSASTSAYDLKAKLEAYRRNGVREYLVWRSADAELDSFLLRGGHYVRQTLATGIYRSEVFPGLWLDLASLNAGDVTTLLQVGHQGLASSEHQDFVTQLRARKT